MKRIPWPILALLVLVPWLVGPTVANASLSSLGFGDDGGEQEEFLEPDVAFRFAAEVADPDHVVANWQIAEGYYLYRDKFRVKLLSPIEGVTLGAIDLPPGEEKSDEFFGLIRVFHDQVEAKVPVSRQDDGLVWLKLEFGYQGCAEAGICYPPMEQVVELALPARSGGSGATAADGAALSANGETMQAEATAVPASGLSEQDQIAAALKGSSTWLVLLSFFGFGLLLSFTPCVFPMIPILSSIIVGQGSQLSSRRAFLLSLIYVLAMALTYTVAGVVAGLFGANVQVLFQEPWILVSFSLVFVALAFSMFGFYDIQMPGFLQSRLSEVSNRQQGGTLVGVAVMGLLSALIVGPCVAAPLAGALIYIGQTGDALLGGLALFALSMGMGAPLLAIGASAGRLLPRAGPWMDAVKSVFGVMMLAVAIFFMERVLPAQVTMVLWALLLLVSAIYMGALEPIREHASGWWRLWKGLGWALLVWGGLLLVGAASGSSDPLAPLQRLASAGGGESAHRELVFEPFKGLDELEQRVATAAAAGRPVMVDFYADWCVACKELEKYTFSDQAVVAAAEEANLLLLQADVTANDDQDKALMRHFKLIGPPAILFFGPDGVERPSARLVGFVEAGPFVSHLKQSVR